MNGVRIQDIARRWDLTAEAWDERMGENGDWFSRYLLYPAILKLVGDTAGKRVLDAGCGTGCLSRALARKGAIVIGIDVSARLIAKAYRYEEETLLGISYVQGDLANMPLQSLVFDHIICNMVIQDLPNPQAVLCSFAPMLSGDGKLLISLRHPCFTVGDSDMGWELVTSEGNVIFSGLGLSHLESWRGLQGIVFKLDNYFQRAIISREWAPGVVTISFKRTLQDYIEAMHNAGFVIKRILEPMPMEEGISQSPCLSMLLQRVPNFMIIEAVLMPT